MTDKPFDYFGGSSAPPPSAAGTPVNPPPPVNSGAGPSLEQIQQMIDARVNQVQSDYDKKIADLEARHAAELTAARGLPAVNTLVPTNAGGPGHEITQVWSQWHQELARLGQLTDAHLHHVRGQEPVEVSEAS
jgi:hypothetical protein